MPTSDRMHKSTEQNQRRRFRPAGFILAIIIAIVFIILLIWGSWQVLLWLKTAGGM